jgi:hypothetical protein
VVHEFGDGNYALNTICSISKFHPTRDIVIGASYSSGRVFRFDWIRFCPLVPFHISFPSFITIFPRFSPFGLILYFFNFSLYILPVSFSHFNTSSFVVGEQSSCLFVSYGSYYVVRFFFSSFLYFSPFICTISCSTNFRFGEIWCGAEPNYDSAVINSLIGNLAVFLVFLLPFLNFICPFSFVSRLWYDLQWFFYFLRNLRYKYNYICSKPPKCRNRKCSTDDYWWTLLNPAYFVCCLNGEAIHEDSKRIDFLPQKCQNHSNILGEHTYYFLLL